MNDATAMFAASLKRLRTDRGWSQHALAKRSGVSVPTISNTEACRSGIGLRWAWMLAQAFEVSLDEMCADGPYARGAIGPENSAGNGRETA
jgi:transcriptional regulator with XRE-family HTH domain